MCIEQMGQREREREGSCGGSKWLTFGEARGRAEDLLSVLIEREFLDWEATQSCLQETGTWTTEMRQREANTCGLYQFTFMSLDLILPSMGNL